MEQDSIDVDKAVDISSKSSQEKSGFSIPTDYVTLPSMGKAYPQGSALYNKTEVQVRHLTAADEDIMTSRSLLRTGRALDVMVQNCIIDKNIKVEELIPGDKNALITYLRVSGYGPDYEVDMTCPSCSENFDHIFDLSKLSMNTLTISPVEEGQNAFEYEAPTKTKIVFKYLNSSEEKEINEVQEKIKKTTKSQVDKNVTTRLKGCILSINGETDPAFINKYVDTMPVIESRGLRKYMEQNNPDLIMKQDYSCASCGFEGEVDIPITVSFFWPES